MRPRPRAVPLIALTLSSIASSLLLAPAVLAHTGIEVGEYLLEIGWLNEPAFVGQPNAVQVTVKDHDDETPVTDLGPEALAVVVSTAGVDSPSLPLTPAFDTVENTGPLGEYRAALVPTAPGDYTFHVTGSIRDTPVDVTVTSGEDTFEPVQGSSDLEFPAKLPNLTEVATRLDRIDGRIEALQSAVPANPAAAIADAKATADDASDMAVLAMTVGVGVGALGLIVAVVAIWFAVRAGRKGAGPA